MIHKLILKVATILLFLMPGLSLARGGGSWSVGGNLGVVNASQTAMNTLISRANTRTSGLSLSTLGNAWEGNAFIAYRFKSSSLAWQLRPSFFYQNESGGSHEYGVTGFTVFPVLRFYMLEDKTIKFYSQFGVGFGTVSGKIKENGGGSTGSLSFKGSDMGYLGGLGAEFCFFSANHCINVEGNLRVLSIDRTTSSDSGTGFASNSVTVDGKEVEYDSQDLGVSLSGIQGFVGYTMYF